MSEGQIILQPDTLWERVKKQTNYALNCGALLSIPTEFEFIEQNGVKFLVRILSNLDRKNKAKKKQQKQSAGKDFNPFLPYEQDLFVADISDTHVCILNKFNVVDYHLLIITRDFEEQESLLTLADFAAMWACLAGIDGLVFYNSGKIAGASQRHKHLQLVPITFTASEPQIPIASLLASAKFQDSIATIPGLPFVHAFAKLQPEAKATLETYYKLLRAVGLGVGDDNGKIDAYNLLVTREWMLIVPRSQEHFQSISVNSLGFAGALLVKNDSEMQLLKQHGPMTILKEVAMTVNS
ncbi:ATP adenylyltransferase family protein [Anabaena subtropica]|uniref:Phosphorylase n=1 Tax=Anabaena subtropica FACHB-260 TaxID=2692884 RepID=A0ABR8CUF9_9NOST|nr:phosphorylase [Anabaena subtropica]MBD2346130.1 phosphorylase [Anabaena subtropica FACHB-260]